MKTVRLFSIVMAVVMLAVAAFPFAASASSTVNTAVSAGIRPVQAFADAAMGLPLFAPMNMSMALLNFKVESVASSGYSCTYISQTPKDWVQMRSRQSFDMKWTVQNTGSLVWHPGSNDLKYISGTKMQTRGDTVHLASNVGLGKKVNLVVDMSAPKALGTYTALWSLVASKTNFCKVTIVLTVTR